MRHCSSRWDGHVVFGFHSNAAASFEGFLRIALTGRAKLTYAEETAFEPC